MKQKRKIVIYGGSFNPPHMGHVAAIEAIQKFFLCDEIWVMPSGDREDKTIGTNAAHRIKMLEELIREFFSDSDIPILVSELEVGRAGFTTTYDTKLQLESDYPNAEFYFFVGSDIISDIESKWVKGRELFKSSNFLVIQRSDIPLPKKLSSNVIVLSTEITTPDISSTFVRSLLSEGKSASLHIPDSVAKYIQRNGLYR